MLWYITYTNGLFVRATMSPATLSVECLRSTSRDATTSVWIRDLYADAHETFRFGARLPTTWHARQTQFHWNGTAGNGIAGLARNPTNRVT